MRARCHVPGRTEQAGVTLLEVLIAIALVGISFAALFSVFSTALRSTYQLRRYDRALECATNELNALTLDPALQPNQTRFGSCPMDFEWKAETHLVEKPPGPTQDNPGGLVKIVLNVYWDSDGRHQSVRLETLKLVAPEARSTL